MEQQAVEFLKWIIETYPIAGTIIIAIALSYTLIKMIVVVTPTKKDDKILERLQKTWIGQLFELISDLINIKKK